MNLITGRAGAAHITPRQDAMWHQGLIEMESCIFDAYENFAAEIITNNEVRIRSGVGMLQGRFFCIEPNTYDSAEIANGNQGEERTDLIVARITVDASVNTQSASIVVIQGTPAAENPTTPEAITGDLDAGDLIADYPLAKVHISGINITSIENTFNAGWLSLPQTRQNINYIGLNPIASTDDDTPANWKTLGTGHAYFNAMRLKKQPAEYGFVESIVHGSVVSQVFTSFTTGTVGRKWSRIGNSAWNVGWTQILTENTGIQKKLLWTNASPTSSFSAQTISLDLSEYDGVEIQFNFSTSNNGEKNANSEIGGGFFIDFVVRSNDKIYGAYRTGSCNSEGISIDDCYALTATAMALNNSLIIPSKIYGIKGVQ